MLLQRKAIVFLLLNAIRLIGIYAVLSVFATLIYMIVKDANTYAQLNQDGTLIYLRQECEYLPSSNIPTTTLGIFWTQFYRSSCMIICVVLLLTEVGGDAVTEPLFRNSMPIFSSSYSTAPIGLLQVFLASALLSHYLHGYTLVSAWLLSCVGALNFLFGLVFGADGKLRRSFKRRNRDRYEEQRAKRGTGKQGMVSSLSSLSKVGIADLGKKLKRRSGAQGRKVNDERGGGEEAHLLPRYVPPTRAIPTAWDAFKGRSTYGVGVPRSVKGCHERQTSVSTALGGIAAACDHDEVLRWRARQENIRVEKMNEMAAQFPSSSSIRSDSIDSTKRNLSAELTLNIQKLKEGQQKGTVEARVPPTTPTSALRKTFKRRTLVLSKMVANVKRGSVSAATAARQHVSGLRIGADRRPNVPLPPMPGAYGRTMTENEYGGGVRRGIPSNERATAWLEVESDRQTFVDACLTPPATYKPDTVYTNQVHCARQFHLPITKQTRT